MAAVAQRNSARALVWVVGHPATPDALFFDDDFTRTVVGHQALAVTPIEDIHGRFVHVPGAKLRLVAQARTTQRQSPSLVAIPNPPFPDRKHRQRDFLFRGLKPPSMSRWPT